MHLKLEKATKKQVCNDCKQVIEVQSLPKHSARCAGIIQREVGKCLEAVVKQVEAKARPDKRVREHRLPGAVPSSDSSKVCLMHVPP